MQNEDEIIAAIIAGDENQYRALVERYHIGLIIHCEQMLHDRANAEDIAQDAFIQAYQKLATYDSQKAKFSTWLYRIATNKCLDELRKHRQHVTIDGIEDLPHEVEQIDLVAMEQLRAAVIALEPPQYRRIIEAYFWEGKSYEAIAKELAITPSNVGVSMLRAKAKLKEVLS